MSLTFLQCSRRRRRKFRKQAWYDPAGRFSAALQLADFHKKSVRRFFYSILIFYVYTSNASTFLKLKSKREDQDWIRRKKRPEKGRKSRMRAKKKAYMVTKICLVYRKDRREAVELWTLARSIVLPSGNNARGGGKGEGLYIVGIFLEVAVDLSRR
jgi:hypothetical protein